MKQAFKPIMVWFLFVASILSMPLGTIAKVSTVATQTTAIPDEGDSANPSSASYPNIVKNISPISLASQPACQNVSPPTQAAESFNAKPHVTIGQKTDEIFNAGDGGCFDQWRNNSNLVDGKLRFTIDIDRYYSNYINSGDPSTIDSNGFLTTSARNELVSKGVLPAKATVRLMVWDVDESAPCPERDYVFINNKPVMMFLLI